MKKLILTVLMLGLWGTVAAGCGDLTDEDIAEDSLWIKHCRVDTIGWVAEVCETYFEWESPLGGGCTRSSGDVIYSVASRLVWNRKEKPPTMQWVVRTKTTCWYLLNRKIIDNHLDSSGEEE